MSEKQGIGFIDMIFEKVKPEFKKDITEAKEEILKKIEELGKEIKGRLDELEKGVRR